MGRNTEFVFKQDPNNFDYLDCFADGEWVGGISHIEGVYHWESASEAYGEKDTLDEAKAVLIEDVKTYVLP